MSRIVSTGSTLTTPEYRKKRVEARRRQATILLSIFLVLIILVVVVLRLGSLKIKEVEVVGTDALVGSKVADSAKEILSHSYLGFLPKSNVAIYPSGELEEVLPKLYPRISTINTKLVGVSKIIITVSERKPLALYCEESECYFLDDMGVIYDKAPSFSDGVYFIYRRWHDDRSPLGSEYVSYLEFRTLVEMIRDFKAMALEVEVEPRELVLLNNQYTLTLSTGATVVWPRSKDASKIVSDLRAFTMSPQIKGVEKFWLKVKSLDLRTANKVFYTFRDE